MSWIGGSLSSLTGQLSNLTKDILSEASEGTEEVSGTGTDPGTELNAAKAKIIEYEALVGTQKAENDCQKLLIRELEEKSESAELQINSISREYHCLLEEKEKGMNELKHNQNEILQHRINDSLRGPECHQLTPAGSIQSLASSTANDSVGFDRSGYQSDDLDFGDNVRLQQEIDNFSQEVQRLKSECCHWKSIASQVPSEDGNSVGNDWVSSKEILDLQANLKTLEHSLATEKDHHQNEVATLQDLHSQKIAALKQKQKLEVTSLRDQLNNDGCDPSALDELQNQLEAVESKLIETRQQLKVIYADNNVLQEERLMFTHDVEQYKMKAEEAQRKWEDTEQELLKLKQEHSKQGELKSSVGDLGGESVEALKKTADIVESPGNAERQQLTADIMDTLQKENLNLKQKNLELHEQVTILQKTFQTHSEQHQQLDESVEWRQDSVHYEREELSALRQKLCAKETELTTLEQEKIALGLNIDELDAQHQEAIGQVINIRNNLSKKTEQLAFELSERGEEVGQLKQELEQLKQERVILKEKFDCFREQANTQEDKLTTVDNELENKVGELTDNVKRLETTLQEKTNEEKNMMEKVNNAGIALNELHMHKKDLENKLEQSKKHTSEKVEKIKVLFEENTKLREEVKIASINNPNFSKEKEETVLEQLHISCSELENLKEANALLEIEKSELFAKIVESNAKMSKLDDLQNELLRSNETEQSLQNEMESKKLQLETTVTEKFKLEKELEKAKHNFQSQTEQHITRIQELENKVILLQEKFDRTVCNSQSQIEQYDLQIQDLIATKLSLDDDLHNAHDKIREHENRLKEFHAKYECDAKKCKMEIEKLVEVSFNKDTKIAELCKQLDDINNMLLEKELNNKELTEKLELREKQLQDTTSNLELLQHQLSVRDEEKEELKENLVDMEQKLLAIGEHQNDKNAELKLNDAEENLLAQFQEMEKHVVLVTQEKEELEKELHTFLQQSIQKREETHLQDEANIIPTNVHARWDQQSIEEKNIHLKEKMEQIKNKINIERKEWESRCSEFYEQLTSISAENIQMKEALASQMQNFKHDKQKSDEEKDSLLLDLEVLQDQIMQLKPPKNNSKSDFVEEKNNLSCLQNQEGQLEYIKEENEKLRMELKSLTSQEAKSKESVRHLEADMIKANEQREVLQDQVRTCEDLIQHHVTAISQLNKRHEDHVIAHQRREEKIQQQEVTISVLQQNLLLKAEEMCDIQRKFERASSMMDEKSQKMLDDGTEEVSVYDSLPAIEYVDNSAMSNSEVNGMEAVVEKEIASTDSRITEKATVMLLKSAQNLDLLIEDETEYKVHQLEELQQVISEKDSVIAELQQNNSSLLLMLEATSASTSGSSQTAILEIHRLENELRSLKMEKEENLSVMNEKSSECSNLKNEVHQLMNVVATEKATISKLQKDNLELTQGKSERPVDDMEQEALQNLSRLVRDKDFEVQALTQKNETLLALLQESSSDSTQESAQLQAKENLVKQLASLQSEREELIVYLNQKHQESLSYHNEIQKLTAYIGSENEKFETVSRDYESLVPQFEDNKQALEKANNELINYRQKYSELEFKYGELLQRSDAAEVVDAASYSNTVQELNIAKTTLTEIQNLLSEKDEELQNLQRQLKKLNEKLAEKDVERNSMKKKVKSLEFQVQDLKIEIDDLGRECQSSQSHTSEEMKEKQHLQEMNNQLMHKLQENQFELKTSQEKITTLTSILNEQKGAESQVESLMTENEAVQGQARQFQQERDQAIIGLKQLHQDIETDQKETGKMKEREMKLQSELNRLRGHLLQIEEGYTRDALEAEQREKELRNKLIMAEEKLLNSATAVENASQEVSQQVDSLHQQLHSLAAQRDQAYLQIAKLQEQCQQYSVSLANLQMVLEQFQKEKENQIVMETEQYMQENMTLRQQLTNLQSDLVTTNERLEDAADGLEAAARLSEQLDRKEEAQRALREEVQFREIMLKEAEVKIENFKSTSEGKVDKFVMKNLFLGYFATPKSKQHEVIHMVGSVLEFSKEDFDKVQEANRGWVPGFFKFGSAHSATMTSTPTRPVFGIGIQNANKSFSELFVKFLEKESSPPAPTVRLPAEEMARDIEKQREALRPNYNPFSAPRHDAMPIQSGQSSSSDAHILMANESVSSQPLFSSTDNFTTSTPCSKSGFISPLTSSAILKDVLEPH